MYPSIILEHNVYPPHLGKAFLQVYGKIKSDRIKAKHEGNKIVDSTLKLALNGWKIKNTNFFVFNKAIRNNITYKGLWFFTQPLHPGKDDVNEPKSVKAWNGNPEVIVISKEITTPYSVESEPALAE